MKRARSRLLRLFATAAILCSLPSLAHAGAQTWEDPLLGPVAPSLLGSSAYSPDTGKVSLATPSEGGSVAELAIAFRARAAKLPGSVYSRSCPYPFAAGLLDDYVAAFEQGDVPGALEQLWRMDVQLGCVSAARFAGLHGAFRDTVLAYGGGPDAQAWAPVVLLFFEYGGGVFRPDFLVWLRNEAPSLIAALASQKSPLGRIGLLLRDGGNVVRVSGEPAQELLGAVSGDGLESGRCTLLELEELDGEGGRTVRFCPKDCLSPFVELEDESGSESQLVGVLPPDVEAECERRADEKERLRASSVGWGLAQCLEEFNETSPSLLACQAEGLTDYRQARLRIGERVRTREDIYARRHCMVGDDRTDAAYAEAIEALAQSTLDAMDAYQDWLAAVEDVREYDPDFDPAEDAVSGPSIFAACTSCDDDASRDEFARRMNAFAEADAWLTRTVNRYYDDLQRLYELKNSGYGPGDCAPDGTGCSDTCGIEDALAERVGGCIDETTSPGEPARGGAPHPEIAQPDPRGPGYLPGSVSGLQECLSRATGGDSGPQGDPACYDLTCDGDEVPTVDPDAPSGCRCVAPGEQGGLDYCPGYLDCPADPSTPCECVALRDPGASIGSGGEGPTPPPGLDGPERGPYQIPLE